LLSLERPFAFRSQSITIFRVLLSLNVYFVRLKISGVASGAAGVVAIPGAHPPS
jgi:hypothetical protein